MQPVSFAFINGCHSLGKKSWSIK